MNRTLVKRLKIVYDNGKNYKAEIQKLVLMFNRVIREKKARHWEEPWTFEKCKRKKITDKRRGKGNPYRFYLFQKKLTSNLGMTEFIVIERKNSIVEIEGFTGVNLGSSH